MVAKLDPRDHQYRLHFVELIRLVNSSLHTFVDHGYSTDSYTQLVSLVRCWAADETERLLEESNGTHP